MYRDPEVPAGFRDADILQREMEANGDELARAWRVWVTLPRFSHDSWKNWEEARRFAERAGGEVVSGGPVDDSRSAYRWEVCLTGPGWVGLRELERKERNYTLNIDVLVCALRHLEGTAFNADLHGETHDVVVAHAREWMARNERLLADVQRNDVQRRLPRARRKCEEMLALIGADINEVRKPKEKS